MKAITAQTITRAAVTEITITVTAASELIPPSFASGAVGAAIASIFVPPAFVD